MRVNVFDAVTGLPVAYSARLIVKTDGRVDTIPSQYPPSDSLRATWLEADAPDISGRPGVYDVRVERPGYEPWLRTGVEVRMPHGCDQITTVVLTASLIAKGQE